MYKIEDEKFEIELNGNVLSLDPWTVYKALYLERDVSSLLESAESEALEDDQRSESLDSAVSCIRDAFSLDESVSSGQCVKVMEAFIDFCEEAKKKQHGWLTLLQTLVWDSLMEEEALATLSDSESPSKETESST